MAQGEGFKHITVTPPEEEDEVIYAGAGAGGAEELEGEPLQPMLSENGDVEASDGGLPLSIPPENGGVGTSGSEPLQVVPSVGARSVRPASEASAGKPAAEEAPQPSQPAKPPKDPYRDPTLEDLQGNPMPLTQKIVIAVALVCIIGAVIYYFAFMG